MQEVVQAKLAKLREILAASGGVLVAYSGGVDSALLLKVAVEVLGDRAHAVTARSEMYPEHEIESAIALAKGMGARLEEIRTDELERELFVENSPERCYHCKKELFGRMVAMAREEGLPLVVDGANVDDTGDYRPGARAAAELGVRSPLREVGLTKAEIREASREYGLPTWDKPSYACLASRFPYGDRITAEALRTVRVAEQVLRDFGFRQFRVRHHGVSARIEVEPKDMPKLLDPAVREKVSEEFHRLGYLYVTIDLDGYRTGSMNEGLGLGRESREVKGER